MKLAARFGSFKKIGVLFWSPFLRDPIFWGSTLITPDFGKLPYEPEAKFPIESLTRDCRVVSVGLFLCKGSKRTGADFGSYDVEGFI